LTFSVQYGLYHVLLRDAVRSHEPSQVRPALIRWIKVAIVWQVLVLGACGAYLVVVGPVHGRSVAWISPAVGAVFGTAIPLQLVVMAILRSMRA
jgi:hypothetical protein